MRKNNKGFTLIELLAVIVIMILISTIAVSSISSAIDRNKAKQDETKKKMIISTGELYYEEHKNTCPNKCVEVSKLGFTKEELTKKSGGLFGGVVKYDESEGKWILSSSSCN